MDNSYKKVLLRGVAEIHKLESKNKSIEQTGLRQWKIEELKAAAAKEAGENVKGLTGALEEFANKYYQDGVETLNRMRKFKTPNKKPDANMMLYFQNRARAAFDGLTTPESKFAAYENLAQSLDADEQPYRYVVEDGLKASIKDPTYGPAIDEVIEKHQPPQERLAAKEVARRERLLQADATLRGMLETNLNEIAEGDKPSKWDYGDIFDQFVELANTGEK